MCSKFILQKATRIRLLKGMKSSGWTWTIGTYRWLGEAALFRIGGDRDKRKTASVKLLSGDVVMFAGPETCLSRHRPGDRRKLDAGARWRAHQLDPAPCHISEQKNARPGGLTGRYAPLRAGYREGMTGIR